MGSAALQLPNFKLPDYQICRRRDYRRSTTRMPTSKRLRLNLNPLLIGEHFPTGDALKGAATDALSQSPSHRGTLSNEFIWPFNLSGRPSLNPLLIGEHFPTIRFLRSAPKKTLVSIPSH